MLFSAAQVTFGPVIASKLRIGEQFVEGIRISVARSSLPRLGINMLEVGCLNRLFHRLFPAARYPLLLVVYRLNGDAARLAVRHAQGLLTPYPTWFSQTQIHYVNLIDNNKGGNW
jgi:hypothetical protein